MSSLLLSDGLVPKGNLVGRYKGYLMKTIFCPALGQVDQITTKGKDASVLER